MRPLTVRQAALVQEPLQLLAALPAVWYYLETNLPHIAGSAALISLEALQNNCDRWRSALQRYSVCRRKLQCHHVGNSCVSLSCASYALISVGLSFTSLRLAYSLSVRILSHALAVFAGTAFLWTMWSWSCAMHSIQSYMHAISSQTDTAMSVFTLEQWLPTL